MSGIEWQDEQVQLNDGVTLQLRWGRQPSGEGRPVMVLLHEALGCIAMWKRFPEQLAEATGLDVLVFERRGYGQSSPITLPRPDDYLVEEGEVWLPQLLDRLGLEHVILFGHSDGGSIAQIGAASCADQVIAIITLAAHIYVDHLTLAGIREAVERYETTDLPQRLARYHGDRTDLIFRAWSDTWLRPSCYENLNLKPQLSRIRCPALIMQGDKDEYGVPEQVTDACEVIGVYTEAHFIEGCGHVPHLEKPAEVLMQTVDFLRRIKVLPAA
ncbi:alpha/beta fold hydrolase [Marinobacterium sediminicola]|uniref:Pimeloyl-ACP methyl ester carboxylesterase n=1 Tax=Marinobacterium sediminicola TaxID=518898 RepID=A0ABY1RW29_9GAMM|nr:alpha/beta hydrolase [Marinobacterium sediminicola]ULG70456.1 alpha/beta hydrolase [Marinobacterium sediminicola]SMR69287.1 Pimeloyl-ACP methyl ester carboxylesterase [Marinobacterium sediminicola]